MVDLLHAWLPVAQACWSGNKLLSKFQDLFSATLPIGDFICTSIDSLRLGREKMKISSDKLPEKASDFSRKPSWQYHYSSLNTAPVPRPTPVLSVELTEDEMWGADIYVGRRAQCRNPTSDVITSSLVVDFSSSHLSVMHHFWMP